MYNGLLNKSRPPAFCPGCSHERIAHVLDKSFQKMGLRNNQVVMVSDIGCSGLFDTFFNTHALHGLHGRALTYATGLKLALPELNVIITMGDGGMGIGGAHFLSACRRNLNLTLLVLNNFNFGMTGGQFSATTPSEALTGSGFLNRLERPLDVCEVAVSAGATYATRCSAYRKDLAEEIVHAVRHQGFSVIDIWGVCTGRFSKRNSLTPQAIEDRLAKLPRREGVVSENMRQEYGRHYRELAGSQKPALPPTEIEAKYAPPEPGRQDIMMLGSAGQRIVTAGEILCYAGLIAGLRTTQKNDYPITVLRGHSVSEVILSPEEIDFTVVDKPAVIVAIGQEGVDRRKNAFDDLDGDTLIIQADGVDVPSNNAKMQRMNFKEQGIKKQDWALASLSVLAKLKRVISLDMLKGALDIRFKDPVRSSASDLVDRVEPGDTHL